MYRIPSRVRPQVCVCIPNPSIPRGTTERDRNLPSPADGGEEASSPETAPRARVPRPVPHETILNPPW